jgi:hypothetical protein
MHGTNRTAANCRNNPPGCLAGYTGPLLIGQSTATAASAPEVRTAFNPSNNVCCWALGNRVQNTPGCNACAASGTVMASRVSMLAAMAEASAAAASLNCLSPVTGPHQTCPWWDVSRGWVSETTGIARSCCTSWAPYTNPSNKSAAKPLAIVHYTTRCSADTLGGNATIGSFTAAFERHAGSASRSSNLHRLSPVPPSLMSHKPCPSAWWCCASCKHMSSVSI